MVSYRKIIVRSISLALALFGVATVSIAADLKFIGKELFDSHTGLLIKPANKETIFVTSRMFGFVLVLPYSERWEIKTRSDLQPFTAYHPRFAVTVNIVPKQHATDREYLEDLQKRIVADSKFQMRNPTYTELEGRTILRYQVRFSSAPSELANLNKWKWVYWSAAPKDNYWYAMHLTILDHGSQWEKENEMWLTFLGIGFRTDIPIK